MRVFSLFGSNLGNFSFPDFLSLLHAESNSSSEVLHKDFSLLDFTRVDFRTNHRAERYFRSELLGNG